MRRKHWYIIVVAIFALIIFYVRSEYQRYQLYTSPKAIEGITDWWLHVNRFIMNFYTMPTTDEFFNYCANDTFVKENFPNVIPKGFCKNDFLITTDSTSYFSVWLFAKPEKDGDTLYYSEMSFKDFLLKKSVLVTAASLPDPCGSKLLVILNDKHQVRDQLLERKLLRIIRDIRLEEEREANFSIGTCCVHVYFENGQANVIFTTSCGITNDSLRQKIIFEFQPLAKDYSSFDFYFRIDT